MKKIKNIMGIVLASVLIFSLAACGGGTKENSKNEINLMTWGGDFIPREVIDDFTKETGIKVNYQEITTNEDMQSLLAANPDQYDLLVVSDYMVNILSENGYLEKFDTEKMPNFKNINPAYQSKYFDPKNEHSIPYAISAALILYNPEALEERGVAPIESFEDLFQPELENSLVVLDGALEVMGISLKSLGYDFNEKDPAIIEEAKEKMFTLRPNIARFETNTPEDSLINGEAIIGYMYANQATKGVKEMPSLEFAFPSEGMGMHIDSFVMSKDAPNKDGAYEFLNYIMDGEVSAKMSAISNFTNANNAATEFLPEEFLENKMINMPDDVVENASFYKDLGESLEIYDQIYTEFKAK